MRGTRWWESPEVSSPLSSRPRSPRAGASERSAERRRSRAGERSGRLHACPARRSGREPWRSRACGLEVLLGVLLLLVFRALEMAPGLREEDVVERRLVD